MKPLIAVLDSRAVRNASVASLAVVGVVWLVIRFIGLNVAPHGFWMDEAWDAVQVMCLAENGHDADGRAWPLISHGLGGGSLPLTWTAQMVVWTRIVGTSIAGFRSLSALWVVLSCAGLFAIGRTLLRMTPAEQEPSTGNVAATVFPWLVCLAGLVSPWSFQFSRMSWEQPLAPCFLVLAVLAMVRLKWQGKIYWALICGISGACSMITYPPLRVAVPLVLAFAGSILLASNLRGTSRRKFAIGLGVSAVVLVVVFSPIVLQMARGIGTERMMYVSIFAPDWLRENRGDMGSARYLFFTLLDNFWIHLRPSYLFGVGDPNLRHSAHIVGQLSPLDILAVFLAVAGFGWVALLGFRQMTQRVAPRWPRLDEREQMFMVVALSSIVAGMFATLPAALTWETLPHALRTIGTWPFVALFSGAVLAIGWARVRWLPAATALVAVVYSCYFLPEYFRIYKNVDSLYFYRDISEAIAMRKGPWPRRTVRNSLRPFARVYPQQVLRYYLMHDGKLKCKESLDVYKAMHGPERG